MTSDKSEAERIGKQLVASLLRDEEVITQAVLTLGDLWARYKTECVAFLDNTSRSKKEAEGHANVLIGFFGKECDVRGLTEQDQIAFTRKRLAGDIANGEKKKTKTVRTRSVEVDLQLLHTMLRWAVTVRTRTGTRLLEHNPLAGVKRPREKNPKRPVATWERFQTTRKSIRGLVAKAKTHAVRRQWLKVELALILAEATGRRLGAIRQLRWEDVDLTRNSIRWRAEADKKGKEWVIPITQQMRDEVRSFRVKLGGSFGSLLFPTDKDPTQSMSRDTFGHLLASAERKAKLPKLDGSLWHAYRRSWATSRKGLPVAGVAAAGGWSDISTLLNCYQQADHQTLLDVMSHSKKISEVKAV
jgi:integrase